MIIGAGSMGTALGAALGRSGIKELLVVNSTEESTARAAAILGATAAELTDVARADLVILGVKPQQIIGVARKIAPLLQADTVVVSLAAGVSLATIEAELSQVAVIRAMPNTPVQVGQGVVSLTAGSMTTAKHMAWVKELLAAAGLIIEIPEKRIEQVIAVAGSAPAYIFYVIEAMVDAAVAQGMQRSLATQLAIQTVAGSAKLLHETADSPTVAREKVTSPGGVTAKAIRELDERAVKAAIAAAMDAAAG
ncbi:MAG: pyrroline-5-carboxylate reductase [Propionibacteriaceae bacterium]